MDGCGTVADPSTHAHVLMCSCAQAASPSLRSPGNSPTVCVASMPATLSTNPYAPSAAQPGAIACLALADLNKASAKTGGWWDVVAFLPSEDSYSYTWQGQNRQGCILTFTLVSRGLGGDRPGSGAVRRLRSSAVQPDFSEVPPLLTVLRQTALGATTKALHAPGCASVCVCVRMTA